MRTAEKENECLVKERIGKDLADHAITVKHADGMYRHWRCQKPGTSVMYFDVVTWPGSLCFTGDMGDFLFQRTEDMVAFMSRACRDYQYAAEKCVAAGREAIREWSEERFQEVLRERLEEAGEEGTVRLMRRGSMRDESVKDLIEQIQSEYDNYSARHDAEKAMYESGLWDGCDMPTCERYTVHFLWCLHAIQWFCERVSK